MMKMIIFGFVLVLCLGLAWPQPETEPERWPGLAWRLAKFINALCEHLATRWGVSLSLSLSLKLAAGRDSGLGAMGNSTTW